MMLPSNLYSIHCQTNLMRLSDGILAETSVFLKVEENESFYFKK